MEIQAVRDTVTGATYTLDITRALGAGATAVVWRGVAESTTPTSTAEVAIKVARSGTSRAALEEFWMELKVFDALHGMAAQTSIPWMHRGEALTQPATPIIVMELIGADWQLTRYADHTSGKLAEDLALRTGLRYASLLCALHTLRDAQDNESGIVMRGDRKATDLRWDASNERLIVLDWNRAAWLTVNTPRDVCTELIRQDLRTFGQLWATLTLGRSITTLPPLDDPHDADWATLSRGFRTILARSLGSTTAWGYQHATELLHDLEKHQHRYQLFQTGSLASLSDAAATLHHQAETASTSDHAVQLADEVLILVDLAQRAPDALEQAQREELIALHTWATNLATAVTTATVEAIEQIKRSLGVDDYEEAHQAGIQALSRIQGADRTARQASLRLNRWYNIARIGVRGNDLGLPMNVAVRRLQECTAVLEAAALPGVDDFQGLTLLQRALDQLQQAIRTTPPDEQIEAFLHPLLWEIKVRMQFVLVIKAHREQRRADARTAYDQVLTLGRELAGMDPLYAENLRADLAILHAEFANMSLQQVMRATIAPLQDQLRQVQATILNTLQAENDTWDDLTPALEQMETLQREIRLSAPADLPLPADGMLQYSYWLHELNHAMCCGDIVQGYAWVQQLASTEHWVRAVRTRWQRVALAEAQRIQREGRWPDELARGLQLLTLLKQDPWSLPALSDALHQIEPALQEWSARLEHFRQRLGPWATRNDLQPIYTDLENSAIDAVLQEASTEQCELFDRQGVSAEQVRGLEVAAVQAGRQAARLLKLHKTFIQAEQDVRIISDSLQAEAGTLSASLAEITQALATYRDNAPELAMIQEALPPLRANLERVAQLSAQLPAIQTQIQTLQQALKLGNDLEIGSDLEHCQIKIAELTQAEDQLKAARRRFTATEAAINQTVFKAQRAIVHTWVGAGLQAVRDLNKSAAETCLDKAGEIAEHQQPDAQVQAALDLLRTSITWLTTILQQDDLVNAVKQWRTALTSGRLAAANVARGAFRQGATQSPAQELLSSWVIGELQQEHMILETQTLPGKIADPAYLSQLSELLENNPYDQISSPDQPDPIRATAETATSTAVTDSIPSQRTSPAHANQPSHPVQPLPEHVVTHRAPDDRSLTFQFYMENMSRPATTDPTSYFQNCDQWLKSLKAVATHTPEQAQELEQWTIWYQLWEQWSTWRLTGRQQFNAMYKDLPALLGQTDALILCSPEVLPAVYWQGLHNELKNVYFMLRDKWPDISPQFLVWTGILSYKAGTLTAVPGIDKQTIAQPVKNRIINPLDYICSLLKQQQVNEMGLDMALEQISNMSIDSQDFSRRAEDFLRKKR